MARCGARLRSYTFCVPKQAPAYADTELFRRGVEARTAVLGAAFVEKALNGANDFNAPMQQLATEHCWGAIWSRPGLARKTRSLLNVAMMVALNRSKELETHLRGALANGATIAEIQETLLQAAVYAGIPAGMEAFRVATPVVDAYLAAAAPGTPP
jgi:4-carboxymuconolactone decarboxylase